MRALPNITTWCCAGALLLTAAISLGAEDGKRIASTRPAEIAIFEDDVESGTLRRWTGVESLGGGWYASGSGGWKHVCGLSGIEETDVKIDAGTKLVMIGDSITDCGRARAVDQYHPDALGNGYVSMVNGMLGAVCPERRIRVVNVGNSGDTVRELKERWERDVLDLRPDSLSIMIGINDVHRSFLFPLQVEIHVSIEEYERTLREMLGTTRPSLKHLILMSPYYVEPDLTDPCRARMDRYRVVLKELADEFNAIWVDTQAAIDRILEVHYPAAISLDRIHVNAIGHMAISRAFAKAIELEW